MQKQEDEKGREKTIRVYKFNELDQKTQDKVLDRYSDINVDYEWWDEDGLLAPEEHSKGKDGQFLFTYDTNKTEFNIEYSGHIQFEYLKVSNNESFRKLLKIPQDLWNKIDYNFVNGNSENTSINFTNNESDLLTSTENIILDEATEIFDKLVDNSLKYLKDQYNYLTSKESIIETLEANEYEFLENGYMAP